MKIKQSRQTNSEDFSFGDLGSAQLVAFGFGIMLLFTMCTQQSPNSDSVDSSNQKSIERSQDKVGVIQVNRSNKNVANLRSSPNGKVIGVLPNSTRVILGEVSSDGQWQKVSTKDGEVGWVWAEFVRE